MHPESSCHHRRDVESRAAELDEPEESPERGGVLGLVEVDAFRGTLPLALLRMDEMGWLVWQELERGSEQRS